MTRFPLLSAVRIARSRIEEVAHWSEGDKWRAYNRRALVIGQRGTSVLCQWGPLPIETWEEHVSNIEPATLCPD